MIFGKKKKGKPQQKPSMKKKETAKEPQSPRESAYIPPKQKEGTKTENFKQSVNAIDGVLKKTERHNWENEFVRTFKKLTFRYRAWDIWRDFIVIFACAISNPVDKTHQEAREARYLEIINKYSKQEQRIFPELAAMTVMALDDNQEQDFLGKMFMDLNLGNRARGQFFTPYHVCQLMADITTEDKLEEIERKGFVSVCDCCCGAGATLIAAVHSIRRQLEKKENPLNFQNHVLVVGQDIDETVALMCYIQISLLGVAGYIKIGDALTDPITDMDTSENYWFTPMYFSDMWTYRRIFHNL